MLFNKQNIAFLILVLLFPLTGASQCLMSVNPVGGTANILTLEKNTLRVISFYKYGGSSQYFKGSKKSDFALIDKSYYNYLSANIAYGFSSKFTIESELGYYINKIQHFAVSPVYKVRGYGFSNAVLSGKYTLYSNQIKRNFFTVSGGAKIPFRRTKQQSGGVDLPIDVQPTLGAYGMVFQSFYVNEVTHSGMRYFISNRFEYNFANKYHYKAGSSLVNSFYASKHLVAVPGDWTVILQLRNELRNVDRINDTVKPSSGSVLLFVVPQINYVYKEKLYVSLMADIPFYQYFKGEQLGAGLGFTLSISRSFSLL